MLLLYRIVIDSASQTLRERDIWQLLVSLLGLRSFATGYFWKPYEGAVYKPLVTSSELKTKMSELLMTA
jgi:hypothetical protein